MKRSVYELKQDPSTIRINVVFLGAGAMRYEGYYTAYVKSATPGEVTPVKGPTEGEVIKGILTQLQALGAIKGRQYLLSRDIELEYAA